MAQQTRCIECKQRIEAVPYIEMLKQAAKLLCSGQTDFQRSISKLVISCSTHLLALTVLLGSQLVSAVPLPFKAARVTVRVHPPSHAGTLSYKPNNYSDKSWALKACIVLRKSHRTKIGSYYMLLLLIYQILWPFTMNTSMLIMIYYEGILPQK